MAFGSGGRGGIGEDAAVGIYTYYYILLDAVAP